MSYSKPIVEFDNNFPSSRDARAKDANGFNIQSLDQSRSDFGTIDRHSHETTEHASFGGKAIQSSRFRQISGQYPAGDYSMESDSKNNFRGSF